MLAQIAMQLEVSRAGKKARRYPAFKLLKDRWSNEEPEDLREARLLREGILALRKKGFLNDPDADKLLAATEEILDNG
jgi:hypothetical protein